MVGSAGLEVPLKELAHELGADARKILESVARIFQCGRSGFRSTDRAEVERHLRTQFLGTPQPDRTSPLAVDLARH
jgi:hypothetical protein